MSKQKLRKATEEEVREIPEAFMADDRAQRHMADSCGIWRPSKSILVVRTKEQQQLFFWIPEKLRRNFYGPSCGAVKMIHLLNYDYVRADVRSEIIEAIQDHSKKTTARIEEYARMEFYELLRVEGILALTVLTYRTMSYADLLVLLMAGDPFAGIILSNFSTADFLRTSMNRSSEKKWLRVYIL